MKKIYGFLLMAVMLIVMGASVASCSSDDDGDKQDNNKEISEFLQGKEWFLGEGGRAFSFYRNHMVLMDAGGVAVGGGVGGYD